jgi:hypothetical protein
LSCPLRTTSLSSLLLLPLYLQRASRGVPLCQTAAAQQEGLQAACLVDSSTAVWILTQLAGCLRACLAVLVAVQLALAGLAGAALHACSSQQVGSSRRSSSSCSRSAIDLPSRQCRTTVCSQQMPTRKHVHCCRPTALLYYLEHSRTIHCRYHTNQATNQPLLPCFAQLMSTVL